MTLHARAKIRDEFLTVLTGIEPAKTNVFDSVAKAVESKKIPAIVVWLSKESAEILDAGNDQDGRIIERVVSVEIRCLAESMDDAETLAFAVEERMASLGKALLFREYDPPETTLEEVREGEVPYFGITLAFDVTYTTAETNPGLIR